MVILKEKQDCWWPQQKHSCSAIPFASIGIFKWFPRNLLRNFMTKLSVNNRLNAEELKYPFTFVAEWNKDWLRVWWKNTLFMVKCSTSKLPLGNNFFAINNDSISGVEFSIHNIFSRIKYLSTCFKPLFFPRIQFSVSIVETCRSINNKLCFSLSLFSNLNFTT